MLLSNCADTGGYNNYSSSSYYCDSECQKKKCTTAKKNKKNEIFRANEASFAKCNDTISYRGSFSCSNKINNQSKGYSTIKKWDEESCSFICVKKCFDKSKCGSVFEKTSGWLGDLFEGDNSKEKKEKKKIEIPKTTTTKCNWDFLGNWVCRTR